MANLATVHPEHWDGVISADDVCDTWWTSAPYTCGVLADGTWDTQILHQPSWELYAALALAGVEPTAGGYRIAPHVPLSSFSLHLPDAGVDTRPGTTHGYVRPETASAQTLQVRLPAGATATKVLVGGRRVPANQSGRWVTFTGAVSPGQALDWTVQWSTRQ